MWTILETWSVWIPCSCTPAGIWQRTGCTRVSLAPESTWIVQKMNSNDRPGRFFLLRLEHEQRNGGGAEFSVSTKVTKNMAYHSSPFQTFLTGKRFSNLFWIIITYLSLCCKSCLVYWLPNNQAMWLSDLNTLLTVLRTRLPSASRTGPCDNSDSKWIVFKDGIFNQHNTNWIKHLIKSHITYTGNYITNMIGSCFQPLSKSNHICIRVFMGVYHEVNKENFRYNCT